MDGLGLEECGQVRHNVRVEIVGGDGLWNDAVALSSEFAANDLATDGFVSCGPNNIAAGVAVDSFGVFVVLGGVVLLGGGAVLVVVDTCFLQWSTTGRCFI